jgi:pectate lyase
VTIHYKNIWVLVFAFQFACVQPKAIVETSSEPIAFPGAEGFGKYTTGGRGGTVYVITNLNDDGEGSLRHALNRSGVRIIVFAVSGTIHLLSPLNIKSNTTIAGQTAPGDGICIADHPVKLDGDNIIVRYMRFRMGDRYQNQGMVHGSGHDDALSANGKKNIIIDHCSMSWSTDEVVSVYAGDSTTLQWNIISEPLNYSYHFERGGTDYQQHGYGGIWGGRKLSAHHNLFAHCVSRTPRFDGIRNIDAEFVDYRNNVIYNWGSNNVYAGEGGTYNIINNYYKAGPDTKKNVIERILNPFKREPGIPFGKFYVDGNFVDGSAEVSSNNWLGVVMNNGTNEDKLNAKQNAAFAAEYIQTQTAVDAYHSVLAYAGASFRRDTLDQRIINNVKNKTGRIIDVQGGYSHGTSYDISKTAWPNLKRLPPPVDSDKDGMPDEWEKKNGLNPNDATDASKNHLHKHYTNIEVYINSIIAPVI